jgi:hypothetical protein
MDIPPGHVREMNGMVVELARSHAIFWVLLDHGSRKQYSKVFGDHRDFFDATPNALFQGFCVITYALFDDKRTDIKSLPRLINRLTSNPALQQELRSKIDAEQRLLQKFVTFRHKIFAHRDKAKSPADWFGKIHKAQLRRDMESVVRLAREVTCALAGATGVGKKSEVSKDILLRENYARWDTVELLKRLARVED